jgi:hypothetical protein
MTPFLSMRLAPAVADQVERRNSGAMGRKIARFPSVGQRPKCDLAPALAQYRRSPKDVQSTSYELAVSRTSTPEHGQRDEAVINYLTDEGANPVSSPFSVMIGTACRQSSGQIGTLQLE